MDLNRSSHINRTNEDFPTEVLPNPTDSQRHQSSENGVLFVDLDDDLSLGTDARVFSSSGSVGTTVTSPESSSLSTGFNYESSSESTGYPESPSLLTRKLDGVERLNSIESSLSDFSDFSRTSHDVSSLLNAMTVDPEEFLAGLGFAESDMRMRIPDRFLESPSQAQGIDVESFRRSLEQDDLYGSSSQDSPVWSDPGSSRIPLRFIASHAEPINPVFSGGIGSIPLISEPEDAPEDSFDLMRHLRLNKPQHVTKGMFLEPVTEELEVSSVGSGSVRTKISRKLSNEEGTIIVREESLEQAVNVESELFLNVPVIVSEQTGFDSNETNLTTDVEIVASESGIVVNVDDKDDTSSSLLECAVLAHSVKSSSEVVNSSNYSIESFQSESRVSDDDDQEPALEVEETIADVTPVSAVPVHLRVANIIVQDSFELEEIGNEEFNEKELSASTDQENSLVVKSSEKRLVRENSGESSGFEEMFLDKESASPISSSPILEAKEFPNVAHVIVSDRRPLQALLDPEMLSLAVEEKSPRATFAQRRTKSLTKQRPIDEETYASWAFSPRPSAAKCVDDSLGTSVSHSESGSALEFEETGSSFLVDTVKEPVTEYLKSNLRSHVSETDENCNRMLKIESGKLLVTVEPSKLEESNYSSFGKQGEIQAGSLENKLQTSKDSRRLSDDTNSAMRQSESSLPLRSDEAPNGEENISHSRLSEEELTAHEELIALEGVSESNEDVSKLTDSCFPTQGDEASTHTEQEEESETSLSEENESAGACAEVRQREESQKALRKIDSECQQHYLHEINVLEQSIQKYESHLSSEGPLDGVRASNYTKHMLVRITEEVNAIHELRLLISSELERMRCLLSERRKMLLAGATRSPVCSGVTQKMADLLREQSSLNIGLSDISDELAIRKKASRRARIYAHIDGAKKELKEEREKCMREFREEIKETLARELSERFSSEINLLRHEVRAKDEIIEQLMKNQEQKDLEN